MTVYVDSLMDFGWVLRGRPTKNCHLFTDQIDLEELHKLAQAIGMKRAWFQNKPDLPHYDLTPSRRAAALLAGAVGLSQREAVEVWRKRREQVCSQTPKT